VTAAALLASLPSPGSSSINLGPFEVRAYGLAIAVGVIVAVTVAQRRWAARGGDPADVSSLATWSVIAGIIGARAYHVITDYHRFQGQWLDAVKVWEGGLGIPGGLLAGVVTGVILAGRRGLPAAELLDVVAPTIPIAQAIGRVGNWFNQELFGRPTELPWGLRIDPARRPDGYEQVATFHPTFLYEGLWNLALAGLLVLYERRRPDGRPGRLFALYVGGYGLGRLWVEALRIDDATRIAGVRVNIWVSLVAIAAATAWMAFRRKRTPEDSAMV
jgi:prolipoprotein diacylglyceryl transferase